MRKFLIVGCGGSGGATLSYMMDDLRSELARYGIKDIPAGWQFIHVDVPVGDSRQAKGLGSVGETGGAYYGTGAQGVPYSVVDAGVSRVLQQKDRSRLDLIGTWAPRGLENVTVAISQGAGQYRSVGRMITLSKSSGVFEALGNAWGKLSRPDTDVEMQRVEREVPGVGAFSPSDTPIVLVVSSMAGGAGASMAIDVCRLLTLVPGVESELIGIFMVTAEVFDSLPPSSRTGVRANALAMLGEIVATQTGAAREHDVALLGALGHSSGAGARVPFQRVFPVGKHVGAQRTLFGDGSQHAVYRGLARGLSALMRSEEASTQFVAYDLANTGSPEGQAQYLGWGENWDALPWGSFGFASLSMGRERYREYAAQRLSRTVVDSLVTGHMMTGSTESSPQQVARRLEEQWAHVCGQLKLPAASGTAALTPQQFLTWFTSIAFPREGVAQTARALVDLHVVPQVPSPAGQPIAQWLPTLRAKLNDQRTAIATGVSKSAHELAYDWQVEFVANLEVAVVAAVSSLGVPYAIALVEQIEAYLTDTIAPALHELAARGQADLAAPPAAFLAKIGALKGTVANGEDILNQLFDVLGVGFRDGVWAQAATITEKVVYGAPTGLCEPLKAALREGLKILEQARQSEEEHLGLADVATDIYGAWPSDQQLKVPARFEVANNEVLLTKAAEFPARYIGDVVGSVKDAPDPSIATAMAVQQVTSGVWPTTDADGSPRGLLTIGQSWRSAAFVVNPHTQQTEASTNAMFHLHVAPAEILDRARAFVLRGGVSFDNFCRVSLRDYVLGTDSATESELRERYADIGAKFREALVLARPLISVSKTAVNTLHGGDMQYRYKFSEVPFKDTGGVAEDFVRAIESTPDIDESSLRVLNSAMTANDRVTRVDIFGSYPNYSPLAFDSVLEPVAREWLSKPEQGRAGFWRWRRSRPLAAALPMGDAERHAMVAGWFVGRATGRIRIPLEPFDQPVQIWDQAAARWVSFPHPLLTPPDTAYTKSVGFGKNDWLPAVLESVLIAFARAHEGQGMESLKPYQLLRGLADSRSTGPSAGLGTASATIMLADWLRDGETGTGLPSGVKGVAAHQTIGERVELTRAWFEDIMGFASREYLAPGDHGAVGGGVFSIISTREHASAMPLFHDVAGDAVDELKRLVELLPMAAEAAKAPRAAAQDAPLASPMSVPESFSVPDGGDF